MDMKSGGWRAIKVHCDLHGLENALHEMAHNVWESVHFEALPEEDELLVIEHHVVLKTIKKSEIFRYRADFDERMKNENS